METIQIDAQVREAGTSVNALRKSRIIPGVFYGKGRESQSLQMEYGPFRKVYLQAGTNRVIDLNIGKKKEKVLIHDVQFFPLTGAITHVDFLAVKLSEEVTTHVPVEFSGVSLAVKDLGGILTTVKHQIEVKCLPLDIPQVFNIDLSLLSELGSAVHVKDLVVPAKVKVLDDEDDVVVTVSAPRKEEEEAAPATAGLEGTAAEVSAKEEAAAAAAKAAEESGAKKKE